MPKVLALSLSAHHSFTKQGVDFLELIEGLGVKGDAHMGKTVKHRSRVAVDPSQPNLRQVHLIPTELHAMLSAQGFSISAGQMGENITTQGLYLLALPRGSKLILGEAILEVTGLRNPCKQLDDFQPGLLAAVLDKDVSGNLVRKAGIMTIVIRGGLIRCGDEIKLELPAEPYKTLERV